MASTRTLNSAAWRRFFRDEYNPLVAGHGEYDSGRGHHQQGHEGRRRGVFGSLRQSSKFFDVAVQGMGGPGVGRYGAAQLGDVTVRPDGTLEPIKNYHGLISLETHPDQEAGRVLPTAARSITSGRRTLDPPGCRLGTA